MPPCVFALGPGQLRFTRFAGGRGGWRLEEFQETELAADAFGHGLLGGSLRDPTDFRGRLGALLEQLADKPLEASLVVPDAWLRVSFVELEEPPNEAAALDEMLRWKLKRLVPFRVDELRLAGAAAVPLPGQTEPHRMMLGFAIENLLTQVEEAFDDQGVRLGHISNESLSLLAVTDRLLGGAELGALALVRQDAFTLLVSRLGEPILHRFKAHNLSLPGGAYGPLIRRDLKLTRTFLDETLPEERLGTCYLVAPPELAVEWGGWLEEGLETTIEPLSPAAVGFEARAAGGWDLLAPMLGAATREVA